VAADDETQIPGVDRLRDLLYTGVGLGVLAVNRAQAARRSATAPGGALAGTPLADALDRLDSVVGDPAMRDTLLRWLADEVRAVDARLGGMEHHLDAALERLQPQLGDNAAEIVTQVRTALTESAGAVRDALGLRD
jgi:hypothetical protein